MFSNPTPKKEEDKPIAFKYPIIETVPLATPVYPETTSFWDVIKNRKSTRIFCELSLDEISKVLWMSAKVREIFVHDNGYILTKRPSPSAGARHPIDILLLSPALDFSNSVYYYNPFAHSLNKLGLKSNMIEELRTHANAIIDLKKATMLWFVAHPSRTQAKYENALSLIWRDAGALIQSLQLACTGSGINSCAIGTLGEPFISEMFLEYGEVFGVGGIIIG